MPLTSRDSLSRLAIQQIAGSAGSTRYLVRESRPPKTEFEDLSRPENFLIVRIVSLCVGVRPRHNSDWRGGIVPCIRIVNKFIASKAHLGCLCCIIFFESVSYKHL